MTSPATQEPCQKCGHGNRLNGRIVHAYECPERAQPEDVEVRRVPIEEEATIEAALRFDDSELQLAFREGYIRFATIAERRRQSAPPSQRAELLTQEQLDPAVVMLRTGMAALEHARDLRVKVGVSELQAAALLQHIAALTQRVEDLEPAAECWNALSACGRMKLMGVTMAADHIFMEFWVHHDAKGDAQDLEGRDWFCRFMMKAVDAYRALSQEPR